MMKIKHRLALFVTAFALAFVVLGTLAFNTLNALKVNGPYYKKIVMGKDLVADILPPPEYVLEAYLVAHQMADPANRPFLAGLTAKSDSLRSDYEDRHKFWAENLPESTTSEKRIKQTMIEDSYQPALRFLNLFRDQFAPAVQRGDYQTAAALLHGPLKQNYETHRAAIDQVVTLTDTSNQVIEADVNRITAARLVTLAALALAIMAGTALALRRFLQRAITEAVTEKANALSAADAAPQAQTVSSQSPSRIADELAGQTGALALSAALEAARNSEATLAVLENQDRGFHLVAGEIRSLAAENTKLLQQISRLTEGVQKPGAKTA